MKLKRGTERTVVLIQRCSDLRWYVKWDSPDGKTWWYHPESGWWVGSVTPATDGFASKTAARTAVRELVVKSGGDNAVPVPHEWVGPRGPVKWNHCSRCGVIRRADGANADNVCRGPVKVSVRYER